MKNVIKVKKGAFELDDGLPNAFYAFADRDLSITVEKNGGINSIKVWDILEQDGKLYPDNRPTPPIIRKSDNPHAGRALCGPGILFISPCFSGPDKIARNLYHFPEKMRLYPFGFVSSCSPFGGQLGYDLVIHDRSLLFRLSNSFPGRTELVMVISKKHFVSGVLPTVKNFMAHEFALSDGEFR
ncbi:MAG: hypothetical protein PHV82_14280, partial [Victivallaceae bacterium]|nr:hypothetical protein [Victivallaceae bacterium]